MKYLKDNFTLKLDDNIDWKILYKEVNDKKLLAMPIGNIIYLDEVTIINIKSFYTLKCEPLIILVDKLDPFNKLKSLFNKYNITIFKDFICGCGENIPSLINIRIHIKGYNLKNL